VREAFQPGREDGFVHGSRAIRSVPSPLITSDDVARSADSIG